MKLNASMYSHKMCIPTEELRADIRNLRLLADQFEKTLNARTGEMKYGFQYEADSFIAGDSYEDAVAKAIKFYHDDMASYKVVKVYLEK